MKETKEYTYADRSPASDLILLGMMILLMLFIIIKMYQHILPMLLLAAVPGAFLYFQIYGVRISRQFKKYDYGKRVIISEDRDTLTCIKQNNTIVINHADVVRVEIHEQTDLGKFGKYNYMVIYTNPGAQTLITDLTIPLLILDKPMELFLKKVPRVYFKKQFNFIDETKFKP